MVYVLALLIVGLVILERLGRKQKTKLDTAYEQVSRSQIEKKLDLIEGLNFTYGKLFACHLEDMNLILVAKEEYPKSDQIIIWHELGHFYHFMRIKNSLVYKILLYSKGLFYILGILSMFVLFTSMIYNPMLYFLKYLLFILIFVQIVHLIFLTYSEAVANSYLSSQFDQGKDAILYAYTSMMSQILYWFLFIILTVLFYNFIFYNL